MSMKEIRRRKLVSRVFVKAWELYKNQGAKWAYNFGKCLRLAWKIIRGLSRFIFSNVKGVNYVNSGNGIPRQKIIQAMLKYPSWMISLFFKRDFENEFDKNAIKIYARVGDRGSCQVGFLAKELAIEAANNLDNGGEAIVLLEKITRNWNGLGVNFSYAWI